MSLIAITVNTFKELVAKNEHFNRMLRETFAERLIQTSSRASFQQSYSIEFSVSRLLQLLFDQGIQLSKDDMASCLGINIRRLYRALKKLGFKIL